MRSALVSRARLSAAVVFPNPRPGASTLRGVDHERGGVVRISCAAIGVSIVVLAWLAATGCRNIEQLDLTADGGDTGTTPDTDPYPTGFGGLDLLIVIDNSGSMAEEQQLMASAFFPLISRCIAPRSSAGARPTTSWTPTSRC